MYFPPSIWRNIYTFDPTFHEIWGNVASHIKGLNRGRRCEAGGVHEMKAFDGKTDLEIIQSNDRKIISIKCRQCLLQLTTALPKENICSPQ